ncbi:MAG: I78 family peptidase inhibitor [Rhodobacterales bacterium]|nr:I78 family peptidase inhibitor [Rhodobacterales bacterium]
MPRLSFAACLILPAALALAACQAPAPNDPVVLNRPNLNACGATAYADTIGKDHTAYDFSAPGRTVRILGPDSPMTMDHRLERLNVDIDKAGRITRVWCG